MNAGLAAELCYVDAVRPRPADVLAGIRQFWPSVELIDGTGRGGGLMVAFPELTTHTGDGMDMRLLVSVGRPLPQPGDARGRRDLTQTWEWPDAAAVMAAVRHTVTVTEIFGTSFAPANRVRAFVAAVRGVAAGPVPAGIWWPASGVATPPSALAVRPLAGLVNVRLFNVAGSPGLLLMDTLGLAPLGLPDLECVFTGLPEERMAAYLTAIAEYLVAGNTIRAGGTVQGLTQTGPGGSRRRRPPSRPTGRCCRSPRGRGPPEQGAEVGGVARAHGPGWNFHWGRRVASANRR